MNTWKSRFLKLTGAGLQLSAAFFLMLGSDMHRIPFMLLGGGIGIAGLLLWGKGEAAKVIPMPPAPQQIADPNRERMADVLSSLQDDVARLQEDRDFYKDLYLKPGNAARTTPDRG